MHTIRTELTLNEQAQRSLSYVCIEFRSFSLRICNGLLPTFQSTRFRFEILLLPTCLERADYACRSGTVFRTFYSALTAACVLTE